MNTVRLKIKDVTYAELARVLKDLKFVDKSSKDTFRFEQEDSGMHVLLPAGEKEEFVQRAYFAAITFQLEWRGLIAYRDQLGEMIESNRVAVRNER